MQKSYLEGCPVLRVLHVYSTLLSGSVCAAGYTPTAASLSSTVATCSACPLGTYKSGVGNSACVPCPGGRTTEGTGSTTENACTIMRSKTVYLFHSSFFLNEVCHNFSVAKARMNTVYFDCGAYRHEVYNFITFNHAAYMQKHT